MNQIEDENLNLRPYHNMDTTQIYTQQWHSPGNMPTLNYS